LSNPGPHDEGRTASTWTVTEHTSSFSSVHFGLINNKMLEKIDLKQNKLRQMLIVDK